MAYKKTLWKDRVVEKPNTYRSVENPDGTITLYPITGQVIEKGTPVSAANLNKIENGIVELNEQLDTKVNIDYVNSYFSMYTIKNPIEIKQYNPNDFYSLYDSIYENSNRVRIRNLGKDHSGNYDIKMYIYEPEQYDNTIMITCAIHGWENYGTYMMYLILKAICEGINIPPQLQYLKSNTRLLIIPVCNPWGMSQPNKVRYNSRGVDINRNFNWRWEENPTGEQNPEAKPYKMWYKGESAESEAETKLIANVMREYNINSFIDFHNFYKADTETRDYLIYGDTKTYEVIKDFKCYLKALNNKVLIEHTTSQNDSCSNNYMSSVLNIPAINTEFIRIENDVNLENCSKWLPYAINILYSFSKNFNEKNIKFVGSSFINKNGLYNGELINPNIWTTLSPLNVSIKSSIDGYCVINGWITCECSNSDDLITISPELTQANNVQLKGEIFRAAQKTTNRMYIPFNSTIPIKSDPNNEVNFKFKVINEGTGTVKIIRYYLDFKTIRCNITSKQSEYHTFI